MVTVVHDDRLVDPLQDQSYIDGFWSCICGFWFLSFLLQLRYQCPKGANVAMLIC